MANEIDSGQVFEHFVTKTSLHGIVRVFYPTFSSSISKYFRWVWLVALLVALGYAVIEIRETINDFTEYNTVSKVSGR